MDLISEIVKASCGKNEEGKPKSAITFECDMWSVEDDEKEPRVVGIRSAHKPVIDIKKREDFIQIDLIFNSYLDADLKFFWDFLEKYGEYINDVDEHSEELPSFSLTIVPLSYEGTYYILCTGPIFWTLQPNKPGGQANVIRMLFNDDTVGFFETDEVDMAEIQSIVEREDAANEEISKQVARVESAHQEELDSRNQRIEKMRGSYTEMPSYKEADSDDFDADDDDYSNNRFRVTE